LEDPKVAPSATDSAGGKVEVAKGHTMSKQSDDRHNDPKDMDIDVPVMDDDDNAFGSGSGSQQKEWQSAPLLIDLVLFL
jgi:hypothetical protein